jgi:hypothetical protein
MANSSPPNATETFTPPRHLRLAPSDLDPTLPTGPGLKEPVYLSPETRADMTAEPPRPPRNNIPLRRSAPGSAPESPPAGPSFRQLFQ